MRAKLANLNDCAVPFLSSAADNLCWYYYTTAGTAYVKSIIRYISISILHSIRQ